MVNGTCVWNPCLPTRAGTAGPCALKPNTQCQPTADYSSTTCPCTPFARLTAGICLLNPCSSGAALKCPALNTVCAATADYLSYSCPCAPGYAMNALGACVADPCLAVPVCGANSECKLNADFQTKTCPCVAGYVWHDATEACVADPCEPSTEFVVCEGNTHALCKRVSTATGFMADCTRCQDGFMMLPNGTCVFNPCINGCPKDPAAWCRPTPSYKATNCSLCSIGYTKDAGGRCQEAPPTSQLAAHLGSHTCVRQNLGVKCFGAGANGALGRGDALDIGGSGRALKYISLGPEVTEVVSVHTGDSVTCAVVLPGHAVKCWGLNADGQLGTGAVSAPVLSPKTQPAVDLGQHDNITDLAIGSDHSVVAGRKFTCARIANATLGDQVKCWGHGYTSPAAPFINLGTGVTVSSITAGDAHVCAIVMPGSKVKCWGQNANGQLGYGDTVARTPTANNMGDALPFVSLGSDVVEVLKVAAGGRHTCALLQTSTGEQVKCWGANDLGQLGAGDNMQRGSQAGQMGDTLLAWWCGQVLGWRKANGAGNAFDDLGDDPLEMSAALAPLDFGWDPCFPNACPADPNAVCKPNSDYSAPLCSTCKPGWALSGGACSVCAPGYVRQADGSCQGCPSKPGYLVNVDTDSVGPDLLDSGVFDPALACTRSPHCLGFNLGLDGNFTRGVLKRDVNTTVPRPGTCLYARIEPVEYDCLPVDGFTATAGLDYVAPEGGPPALVQSPAEACLADAKCGGYSTGFDGDWGWGYLKPNMNGTVAPSLEGPYQFYHGVCLYTRLHPTPCPYITGFTATPDRDAPGNDLSEYGQLTDTPVADCSARASCTGFVTGIGSDGDLAVGAIKSDVHVYSVFSRGACLYSRDPLDACSTDPCGIVTGAASKCAAVGGNWTCTCRAGYKSVASAASGPSCVELCTAFEGFTVQANADHAGDDFATHGTSVAAAAACLAMPSCAGFSASGTKSTTKRDVSPSAPAAGACLYTRDEPPSCPDVTGYSVQYNAAHTGDDYTHQAVSTLFEAAAACGAQPLCVGIGSDGSAFAFKWSLNGSVPRTGACLYTRDAVPACPTLAGYLAPLVHQDHAGHNITNMPKATYLEAAAACSADPACSGFNSLGSPKSVIRPLDAAGSANGVCLYPKDPCYADPCGAKTGKATACAAAAETSYTCTCAATYWNSATTGGSCESPCVPNPCGAPATCSSNSLANWTCGGCPTGQEYDYSLKACRNTDPCTPNPCASSQVCVPGADAKTYQCQCPAAQALLNGTCVTDPCYSDPCGKSTGSATACTLQNATAWTCACAASFFNTPLPVGGGTCTSPCSPNPCGSTATCVAANATAMTCGCSNSSLTYAPVKKACVDPCGPGLFYDNTTKTCTNPCAGSSNTCGVKSCSNATTPECVVTFDDVPHHINLQALPSYGTLKWTCSPEYWEVLAFAFAWSASAPNSAYNAYGLLNSFYRPDGSTFDLLSFYSGGWGPTTGVYKCYRNGSWVATESFPLQSQFMRRYTPSTLRGCDRVDWVGSSDTISLDSIAIRNVSGACTTLNPCGKGACVPIAGGKDYQCQCPAGQAFLGGTCIADPCLPNPCAGPSNCVALNANSTACVCTNSSLAYDYVTKTCTDLCSFGSYYDDSAKTCKTPCAGAENTCGGNDLCQASSPSALSCLPLRNCSTPGTSAECVLTFDEYPEWTDLYPKLPYGTLYWNNSANYIPIGGGVYATVSRPCYIWPHNGNVETFGRRDGSAFDLLSFYAKSNIASNTVVLQCYRGGVSVANETLNLTMTFQRFSPTRLTRCDRIDFMGKWLNADYAPMLDNLVVRNTTSPCTFGAYNPCSGGSPKCCATAGNLYQCVAAGSACGVV
ncbi:hypothetical protein HYH03_012173 [Edaphochlamys debaryana]|uniref:EGF-like domain-containing protein n=1 Tax=Edaphochlamys debaryana TaxID=47281 RepID=A0A836BVS2_9CHLO|nr:hypothetical protein HYH03_012173 [Edaphochlamys debaryana]|eukprot:KAG2489343.1 hypothetical protein HYH03_012173 [Edaphochlamys debaryana]